MTRVATSNYAGSPDTTFEWATAGTDRFSRVKDLYSLAQALEAHDHSAGKGLSVQRVVNGLIDEDQLAAGAVTATKLGSDAVTAIAVALDAIGALEIADNAVDTAAIQALAVTLAKLAANSVDASKIVDGSVGTAELANLAVTAGKLATGAAVSNIGYTPANTAAGVFTEDIQVLRSSASSTGFILLGNLGSYIGVSAATLLFSGATVWHANNDGVGSELDAGKVIGKIPTATPGAGAIPVADGSGKLDSWITAAAASGVFAGLGGWVATAAGIGAGWARYTNLDGRYPVGAGTASGVSNPVTFIENTAYGSNSQHTHTDSGHGHGLAGAGVGGTTAGPNDTEDAGSGADLAAADGHGHGAGGLDVTGGADAASAVISSTAHQEIARAVVWITKS